MVKYINIAPDDNDHERLVKAKCEKNGQDFIMELAP